MVSADSGTVNAGRARLDPADLQRIVDECATRHRQVGAGVGVLFEGQAHVACFGLTDALAPDPIVPSTQFRAASITKTVTAALVVLLAAERGIELDTPVWRLLTDLDVTRHADRREVTVQCLLNHTAGWWGDFSHDTGDGENALARFVRVLGDAPQMTSPHGLASYNNASLGVAGALISRWTGTPYEQAVRDRIFAPLGLARCSFQPDGTAGSSLAQGHVEDEKRQPQRVPWQMWRSEHPSGGLLASVPDLLQWGSSFVSAPAGKGELATAALPRSVVDRMMSPTVDVAGSAFGDAVGLSWFLRSIGGLLVASHPGWSGGFHSLITVVPASSVVIVVLGNTSPTGAQFTREIEEQLLAGFAGVAVSRPPTFTPDARAVEAYVGRYGTPSAVTTVDWGSSGLTMKSVPRERPEKGSDPAVAGVDVLELEQDQQDRFHVVSGPNSGWRGFFLRGANGPAIGVHSLGRLVPRESPS